VFEINRPFFKWLEYDFGILFGEVVGIHDVSEFRDSNSGVVLATA
jgi:hypothetical protein